MGNDSFICAILLFLIVLFVGFWRAARPSGGRRAMRSSPFAGSYATRFGASASMRFAEG
jgi:hypothetical protein